MPNSPRRRSAVIERLAMSPETSKELDRKGVIMTERVKKQLEMGQLIMETMKKNISQVKPKKGGTEKDKKEAYNHLLKGVLDKTY